MSVYETTEEESDESDVVKRARRREEQRTTIEDLGKWKWSLTVEDGGVVRASKLVPYDGAIAFSTADKSSSRRRTSQHRLDVEQVVGRYCHHSQTELSKKELNARVQAARNAAEELDE